MTSLAEHRIDLVTDEVVKSKPYPLPFSMREIANTEIDTMLELDIIENTDSPYASPIVLVLKRDLTHRFCIDYRKINQITIFDPEPMPQADE